MVIEIEGFKCQAEKGTDYGLARGSVVIILNGMMIGSGNDLSDATDLARRALKAVNAHNEILARLGVPLVEVSS